MRRKAAALLAVAAALCLGSGARAERPAKTLGKAYRAFEARDFPKALRLAKSIDRSRLHNPSYAAYIAAQSAYLTGDTKGALADFSSLAKGSSEFAAAAKWRVADCQWKLGRHTQARDAYEKLVNAAADDRRPDGDVGLARFRIARSYEKQGEKTKAIDRYRWFVLRHPLHPMNDEANRRLLDLGGADAVKLSPDDRIERAKRLLAAKKWHESIAELALIPDSVDEATERRRDFWTARTLFKMRRDYERAGRIFLSLYKDMGSEAAFSLFHGARALSRADKDDEAIRWYLRVVKEYPRSAWADEAQYLAGWLSYNMGKYERGIPQLKKTIELYPRSKWARTARWYLGMSYYLLGKYSDARPYFTRLGKSSGRLSGGKGRYWTARTLQRLDRKDEANTAYKKLVGSYPFSWYALLARARLKQQGIEISPLGESPRDPIKAPAIAQKVDESLASDALIRRADELIAADLGVEAGRELRRGERAFIKRHPRDKALAMLLDRYRKAGNYNRPWMMAVVHGGSRALNAEPKGRARVWWEHAYPRAYRELVEKYQHLGKSPNYYLYSIMRKESGFDPHVHSYADAIGLLQMIPPTTRRVVRHLDLEYTADLLFDPELNVKTGSWYIGRLLQKFKGQIPFGAGSFNSGPRPVMRWLDNNGDRPTDEFVELVSYTQTREYMKKVTETYARYVYLYDGTIYEQPLTVDSDYVENDLTY